MSDENQTDTGTRQLPALNVTPEVLEAGKALVHCVNAYQRIDEPNRYRNNAALHEAERRAGEALYYFRQVVAKDNPHLDYAKIPMYNPDDFNSRRWRMRVESVDPINELLIKVAADEGLSNPERFAVFNKKNPRFQI